MKNFAYSGKIFSFMLLCPIQQYSFEPNGLVSSERYPDPQIITSDNLDHPRVLGVSEANPAQLCRDLQSKRPHLFQLLENLCRHTLFAVVASCVIHFLKIC